MTDFDRWDSRPYWRRVGDAISQLANTLAGGMPDETLSGRSYRLAGPDARLRRYPTPKWRWVAVRKAAEWLFRKADYGRHTELAFWEDIDRCRVRYEAVLVLEERATRVESIR